MLSVFRCFLAYFGVQKPLHIRKSVIFRNVQKRVQKCMCNCTLFEHEKISEKNDFDGFFDVFFVEPQKEVAFRAF